MMGDICEYRLVYKDSPGALGTFGPWLPVETGAVTLSGVVVIDHRVTPLPSAAALNAYLAATGWYRDCESPHGPLWVNGSHRVVIASDGNPLSMRGAVEIIAGAGDRSPGDVAEAVNALQEAPRGHSGAPAADDTGREATTGDAGSQDRAGATMGQPERDLIRADLGQLLDLLGLGDYARPESPHEVFQQCIREVARVIDRNGVLGRIIGSASRELRKAGRDD